MDKNCRHCGSPKGDHVIYITSNIPGVPARPICPGQIEDIDTFDDSPIKCSVCGQTSDAPHSEIGCPPALPSDRGNPNVSRGLEYPPPLKKKYV